MALPTEPTVYTGTAGQLNNSNLLAFTSNQYMPTFRQVVVNHHPALKVLTLNGLGKNFFAKGGSYGNVKTRESTGRGIVFHDGGFQFETPIMTTAPSGSVIGRLGNVNPEHNEPAVTCSYAYKRVVWSIMVPEEFVKDNRGKEKLMDRLTTEFKLAELAAARDVNYIWCGSSSAPTGFTTQGLNYLISHTATTTLGNVSESTYSWWANQRKTCTSVGGGGELDRPLVFLRKLESMILDCRSKAGSSDAQVLQATRGAYQYYRRAIYADTWGAGNAGLRNAEYDAVNIDHAVFYGRPMFYDDNTQVPNGATASTEAVYALDLNEAAMHVKRDEFFDVEQWEAPRTKDKQRFYQMNIWFRGTPAVTLRNIQGVMYNIPANSDAS